MSLKLTLLEKMDALGLQPKRSLGQNFLCSEYVVEQIFKHLDLRSPPFVIEIGPGLGTLTEPLLERNIPYLLIEYDAKIANYWRERSAKVLDADALKLNWRDLAVPNGALVLGNLPYQIGARLVIELSLSAQYVSVMLFMFQKEVAERLMAKTRSQDYSFLTVIAQTYWSIDKVVDAEPRDFFPVPNVSSRVVAFKRKPCDLVFDEKYVIFVKKAFQFRRKFMLKSFTDAKESELLRMALRKIGHKESVRAEEISPEQFQKLFLYMVGCNE